VTALAGFLGRHGPTRGATEVRRVARDAVTPGATPADHDDRLDGLRAIACLMVYWHHTGTAVVSPPVVVFGSTGVYLFFALSGYLLFRPTVTAVRSGRPLPPVGRFYLRRAVRIGPPYLVALALYTAARAATGQVTPTAGELAARALLVSNYFPGMNFYGVAAVFWTLAIEAQFYVLLPLVTRAVLAAAGGRPAAVAAVFVALGVLGRAAETALWERLYGPDSQVVYRSVLSYLDLFGYGMAVAVLDKTGRLGRVPPWAWLLAAAGPFLAANNWHATAGDWVASHDPGYANAFPPLIGLASAAALAAARVSPGRWAGWLAAPPVRFVGRISYSLYLYHLGVQFALFNRIDLSPLIGDFHLRGFVYGLLFLGPTLVVSAAMFYLVERPCLRWSGAIRAAAPASSTPERRAEPAGPTGTAGGGDADAESPAAPDRGGM
jgi:peptidoglycan/LPS O-acetylase OafA/YrhL